MNKKTLGCLMALSLVLLGNSISQAGIVGPYTEDAGTLHLWHLDQTSGSVCFDAVSDNPQTSALTVSNTPGLNAFSPGTDTSFSFLGQAAPFASYGSSVLTAPHSCFFSPWTTAANASSALTPATFTNIANYVNTNTGAFTFEAIIRPMFDPLNVPAGTGMEIVSGDSANSVRAWQWRLTTNHTAMEFNDINSPANGTNIHQFFGTLPATGPDAAVAGKWYHVAVTYTGTTPTNGDQARVFTMYWTLMDPERTYATMLTNFFNDFTNQPYPNNSLHGIPLLCIGGNGGGNLSNNVAENEGFQGYIDEVRISDVCRKSNEMVFNSSADTMPPTIWTQPAPGVTNNAGTTNVFGTVTAAGAPTLAYSWYLTNSSGVTALSDGVTGSGSGISGSATPTLTITNLHAADGGYYFVVVTNNYGAVTSILSQETVLTNPVITAQSPSGAFGLYLDQNETLSVAAAGGIPIHYQWLTNGSPDTTAGTASTYSFSAQASQNGETFQCIVTNVYGAATSVLATLTVSGLPGGLPATPFAGNLLGLNPAAYWPMQETNLPPTADVETNLGSLGMVANAYYSSTNVTRSQSGVTTGDGDTCVRFLNSNGSFLGVPATDQRVSLTNGGPFTVEAWVNPANNTSGNEAWTIVAQTGTALNGGANAAGWGLVQNYMPSQASLPYNLWGWSFHVFNGVGATGGAEAVAVNYYSINTWYHLVGVYDGTNAYLYVNGVLASVPSGTGKYVPDTWDPLTIGADWQNTKGYLGLIDEVAIYTNALTTNQILNHYNNVGNSTYSSIITGDNAYMYWRLDAPAYAPPAVSAYPVATNYGFAAGGNGLYLSGTTPGIAGPAQTGLGSPSYGCAFNRVGTDATNTVPVYINGTAISGNDVLAAVVLLTNMAPSLNLTNQPETLMCWFKANPADNTFQNLIGLHGDSGPRLAISSGALQWYNGAGGNLASGVVNYNDGNWHFVAGVYNNAGSTATGTNSLYVDGAFLGSVAQATAQSPILTNQAIMLGGDPQRVVTGNGNTYNNRIFDGSLAQVAYFTNALTAAQILNLYTNATGGAGPQPFISGQPVTGRTNGAGTGSGPGSYIFFGVNAAGGTPNLSYQWYFNSSSNYSGATALTDGAKYTFSQSLQVTVTNLANSDSGYYFVVVSNNFGSVTSILASFQVYTAPVITAQTPPAGAFRAYQNQNDTLSVTAIGAPTLAYQWYTNGTADTTAGTASSYTLTSVQPAQSGETVVCVVTNTFGSATNLANTLTVNLLPASLTNSTYGSNMLALGPTAYWPMHETAPAAPAFMETNYGTLGALGNGYWSDWVTPIMSHQVPGAIAGDPDTAVEFYNQTNNGCLIVPHSSPLATIQAPYTLEAWIKPYANNTGGSSYQVIMGQGGTGLNGIATNLAGFALQYSGTANTFSLVIWNGSAAAYEQKTTAIYPPGVWYHLVGTFDGTNVAYYINNSLANFGTLQSGGPGPMMPDSWSPLCVGAGRWGTSGSAQPFIGLMDEVAVYTNLLNTTQIGNHYTAGTTVGGNYMQTVTNDNPLLYYRMDSPPYTITPASTWPVLTNYGTTALNGVYHPGAAPGAAAGPSAGGLPFKGLSGTNAMQGNGVSSFADAGIAPTLNPVNYTSFSYTAWFKGNPCDGKSFKCIMAANDSTWRAQINSAGKAQIHGNADVTSPLAYNDGNWHQFVLTAQAVLTNATLGVYTNILYVDGVPVISGVSGATNNPGGAPGPEVLIGDEAGNTNSALIGNAGRSFSGSICEAAFFYGTVLTSNQVQTLYNAAGVPPYFTQQPVSAAVNQGTAFTNTVAVGGTLPLSLQWFFNSSSNYSGATALTNTPDGRIVCSNSTSLLITNVHASDGGYYYAVVSNSINSSTSLLANLTVFSSPTITNQLPATYTNIITLFAGANPTFSVAAVGAVPLQYFWKTNGVVVGGATNAAVTLTNVQVGMLTNFCIVSNFVGTTTSIVWTASVITAPTAPYPAAVMAAHPIGYWRLNEGPDDGNGNQNVIANDYLGGNNGLYTNVNLAQTGYNPTTDPGETSTLFGETGISFFDSYAGQIAGIDFSAPSNNSPTFSVEAWVNGYNSGQIAGGGIVTKGYGNGGEQFDLDYDGGFRFFVRDAHGGVHGPTSAIHTDNNWHHVVAVCDEPNGAVSLYIDSVLAGSSSIPTNAGILTATNLMDIGSRMASAITDNNLQFYGFMNDVAVYNYALSSNQVLAHYTAAGVPPTFTQAPPTNFTGSGGGTMVIPAIAIGTAPLTNTWYDINGGTNIIKQTTNVIPINATLTVTNIPPGWNNDTLQLTVANAYGSTNILVTVQLYTNAPIINLNLPPQVAIQAGYSYTYVVGVYGELPLGFQWYSNNVALAGQTGSNYTFNAASGNYMVIITNIYGSATSVVSSLATVSTPTNSYGTTVLGYGPVGYWPLQETNSPAPVAMETNYGTLGKLGNAYYAVTNKGGTNVLFNQGGALTSSGDIDSAAGFFNPDAVNFAFVPRLTPALTLKVPFTMECWMNSSSLVFSDLISESGNGLNSTAGNGNWGGPRLCYAGNNGGGPALQFYIANGNGTTRNNVSTPANSLPVGLWHHCVATYDGTTSMLYVDGVLLNTSTGLSGANTMAPDQWDPLTIGTGLWQGVGTRGYSGLMDEVAIYTNILSALQVTNHYLAGTMAGSNYFATVLSDSPLLYYRLDSTGYTNPASTLYPNALNFGSAPVNGAYLPGTVPGEVSGPSNVALTNQVAAPINGILSCVDAGYDPSFNRTNGQPFTAVVWFKGNPADCRVQTVMSHGGNWAMNLDGTTGRIVWNIPAAGATQVTSTNVLNDGNWYMLAGVYNGSNSSVLYVNGALNSSGTATNVQTADTTDHVFLGGNQLYTQVMSTERYLGGAIAQAAFYTNALTAAQIQAIYNAAVALPTPTVSLVPSGNGIVITYVGTLLSSTNVVGPYQPVAGATSPYSTPATNAQQFYRVSVP